MPNLSSHCVTTSIPQKSQKFKQISNIFEKKNKLFNPCLKPGVCLFLDQLLAAFQTSVKDGAVRCDACGTVCSEYTSATGDSIDLSLCRRCTEHLRAGLDGLGPDKTPWRYGPSFIGIF